CREDERLAFVWNGWWPKLVRCFKGVCRMLGGLTAKVRLNDIGALVKAKKNPAGAGLSSVRRS
ncbi:hypothetical protein, partial [Escherichia coli]|uniref:hypothetical protein n=1 Tax=Escherichia coli TaxID=562 RepID=UPI001BEBCBFC